MNILEIGIEKGREEGREEGLAEGRIEGIHALIQDNLEDGTDRERIIEKLKKYFSLSEEEAEKVLEKF